MHPSAKTSKSVTAEIIIITELLQNISKDCTSKQLGVFVLDNAPVSAPMFCVLLQTRCIFSMQQHSQVFAQDLVNGNILTLSVYHQLSEPS